MPILKKFKRFLTTRGWLSSQKCVSPVMSSRVPADIWKNAVKNMNIFQSSPNLASQNFKSIIRQARHVVTEYISNFFVYRLSTYSFLRSSHKLSGRFIKDGIIWPLWGTAGSNTFFFYQLLQPFC